MITSEKELEDAETNPKEFVNYQIDLCNEQKSGTYKTQAAKVLEGLVDHVDGTQTFIANLNFEMITNTL